MQKISEIIPQKQVWDRKEEKDSAEKTRQRKKQGKIREEKRLKKCQGTIVSAQGKQILHLEKQCYSTQQSICQSREKVERGEKTGMTRASPSYVWVAKSRGRGEEALKKLRKAVILLTSSFHPWFCHLQKRETVKVKIFYLFLPSKFKGRSYSVLQPNM